VAQTRGTDGAHAMPDGPVSTVSHAAFSALRDSAVRAQMRRGGMFTDQAVRQTRAANVQFGKRRQS
jgi:hypothetical protein